MKIFRKAYNPCGDLTGLERTLCDEAASNFFNLPFAEVMRVVSVKAIAALEHTDSFPNADALTHWAHYNLNDTERRAALHFDTFTPLQAGLSKYLVHVLYENRYNIHFNALADFCNALDDKARPSPDALAQRIDALAQAADPSASVNALIAELRQFLSAEAIAIC